jgi:pimeloyl-ACP methyl ester carboxylesterase
MRVKFFWKRFSFFFSVVLFIGCSNEPADKVISDDGVEISITIKGKGNPTLIFVPGWTNLKEIWDDQMEYFSEYYQSVSIDLPGTGESGNNRSEWTTMNFAKDVATVVNELKLKEVVLIGFSMGAGVVTVASTLLDGKVLGVVLVDNMQNIEMKYPPEMVSIMDSTMMDLVNNMTNEKLVAMGFYKKNHDASFNRVVSLYDEGASQIGWRESFNEYINWLNSQCTETLQKLTVPVIAINSESQPTNVEAFKKYVPSFQAKIITDAGHLLFWDKPEEFNRLLAESINDFQVK